MQGAAVDNADSANAGQDFLMRAARRGPGGGDAPGRQKVAIPIHVHTFSSIKIASDVVFSLFLGGDGHGYAYILYKFTPTHTLDSNTLN